jgi:endonuclease/exonuclease/phosphatase family metal-dependent hydrolase
MTDQKKPSVLLIGIILIVSLLILSFLLILFLTGKSRSSDIIILDGLFEEWQYREPVYTDPEGDNLGGTIDYTSMYIDNDQDYLYLNFDLNTETNLQNGSDLILYIDTDNDQGTGDDFNGLGADLVYDLGKRDGRYYHDGFKKPLEHHLFGLITMPTVTSDSFEIGIARKDFPQGAPVFSTDEIKIALAHNIAGGDLIPDLGDTITYTFTVEGADPPASITLEKDDPSHLRIVSWNTLKDGLLKDKRTDSFQNVLKAINPDIINLQEMYVTQAPKIEAQLEQWFPDTDWHVHKMRDLITISRYPIVEPAEGRFPVINGASPVLIELPDGQQVLIINTHFRCCDQDDLRQREIDEVMMLIRDSKTPGDRVDIIPDTPIIILGDMNLVGYAQQVDTLLYGDIVNEDRFGADFDPDWDDTPLIDLLSRHTETRHTFTWRDDRTSFSPGRLDYYIYTDSVLKVAKHYILDTAELSEDKLAEYGLEAGDTLTASDHLTLVVDFIIS